MTQVKIVVIPEKIIPAETHEVRGCYSCPHFCWSDGSMERCCVCGHPTFICKGQFGDWFADEAYIAHHKNTFPPKCPLLAESANS